MCSQKSETRPFFQEMWIAKEFGRFLASPHDLRSALREAAQCAEQHTNP
jgi:hypothetical protein